MDAKRITLHQRLEALEGGIMETTTDEKPYTVLVSGHWVVSRDSCVKTQNLEK